MKFLDVKVKKLWLRYLLQCLGATLVFILVLLSVDFVLNSGVVASIGATLFIIFTMPHTNRSKPRYILGGYTAGAVSGVSIFLLLSAFGVTNHVLIGSIAVGVCMLLMVITNTEHPPAAAFAYGVGSAGLIYKEILFVYIVTILLLIFKRIAKKWLIDLL